MLFPHLHAKWWEIPGVSSLQCILLAGGASNVRLIQAVWAVLDFVFLAQYPVHTDETLETLEDALACFHGAKDIFIDLGIQDSYNIPKLHFVQHCMMFI